MKTRKATIEGLLALSVAAMLATGCAKKTNSPSQPAPETYASLNAFYAANAPKSQFFTMNAAAGGSFTTTQGTKVTIGPGAFVIPVGGGDNVTVEFKDLYKKSDMLLGQMPVMLGNGAPLKSAGEFFIKATQDSVALNLAAGQAIEVQQPANGPVDSLMKPFVFGPLAGGGSGWQPAKDSVTLTSQFASSYLFSLYSFSMPVANGTWCNSDNSSYFSGYTQTTLSIVPDFVDSTNNMQVYLIFKGINSMVHVYDNGSSQYPYNYAPVGLQCTVVVLGVQNNKLYSSFTPVTISANQTVHVSAAQTTEDDFKNTLKSLDN